MQSVNPAITGTAARPARSSYRVSVARSRRDGGASGGAYFLRADFFADLAASDLKSL